VIARLFGVEEIIEAMFYFNFVSLVRCATFAPPRCAAAAPVRGAVPRNFAPAQRPSDAPALGANRRRQSPAQRCARIDFDEPSTVRRRAAGAPRRRRRRRTWRRWRMMNPIYIH